MKNKKSAEAHPETYTAPAAAAIPNEELEAFRALQTAIARAAATGGELGALQPAQILTLAKAAALCSQSVSAISASQAGVTRADIDAADKAVVRTQMLQLVEQVLSQVAPALAAKFCADYVPSDKTASATASATRPAPPCGNDYEIDAWSVAVAKAFVNSSSAGKIQLRDGMCSMSDSGFREMFAGLDESLLQELIRLTRLAHERSPSTSAGRAAN